MENNRESLVRNVLLILIGAIITVLLLVAGIRLVSNHIKDEIDALSTVNLTDSEIPPNNDSNEESDRIEYGMSEKEVNAILGDPLSSAQYELNGEVFKVLTYHIDSGHKSYLRITTINGEVDSTEVVNIEE